MRLTLPDAANPNRSATYDFPDAVGERFVAWMLAIPLWQRTREQVERKVQDLRLELDTLRQNGTATPWPPAMRMQVAQPEPVVAQTANEGEAADAIEAAKKKAIADRLAAGRAAAKAKREADKALVAP